MGHDIRSVIAAARPLFRLRFSLITHAKTRCGHGRTGASHVALGKP